MAFAVTQMKAFGIEAYEGNRKNFEQILTMTITAAVGDVLLDIGAPTGTFWTSVAVLNAASAAVQSAVVTDIYSRSSHHLSLSVPQLLAKVPVVSGATVATTQYKVANPQTTSFAITMFAGEGLTSYTLAMKWILKDDHAPVVYST